METITKKPIKRLFWDIETSPNIAFVWRAGYRLNVGPDSILQERAVICIAYKWEGEDEVHTLRWLLGNDKAMLMQFAKILEEADEIVAHNGDKFDLKWYNTRHLIHGLDPVPFQKTIDTLAIARRRFYFNSNRLDYIAKYLGLAGKNKTEYQMWKDIVLKNCPVAMEKMVEYCAEDVRILETVYHALNKYHQPKTHLAVLNGGHKAHCPSCGSDKVSKKKERVTAAGSVRYEMQCQDCGKYHTITPKTFDQWEESTR